MKLTFGVNLLMNAARIREAFCRSVNERTSDGVCMYRRATLISPVATPERTTC